MGVDRVLLAHYRMGLLPHIREAFRRMANEFLGVVQVRVTSAVALSELERQALRARFSELTGRQMEMEYFIDERLLGGVRAQIESTVYDGSIRGQLELNYVRFDQLLRRMDHAPGSGSATGPYGGRRTRPPAPHG